MLFRICSKQRLGHPLSFVKEAWYSGYSVWIGHFFLCFQDINKADFQLVRKNSIMDLREEFFLSHGSAFQIDQRVEASLSVSYDLDVGLLGSDLPRKEQGLVNSLAKDF